MGNPHRNYAPDLTGRTFGNLTVIGKLQPIEEKGKRAGMSLCRCSCGNIVSCRNNSLKSGLTTSCGCNRKKAAEKCAKWHGATVKHRRIHNIFQKMTARCYNPHHNRYRRYGGRGIRICDEWRNNFGAFLQWALSNGYQDALTIDRIDVNGPYSPQNCRWADKTTQANNTSKNRWLDLDGKRQTLTQWARELKISPVTLESRLDSGWDVRRALTTPKIG